MKREESQNVEYKESWHDKYGFTDGQLVAAVDNSEYGVAKDVTQTAKPHHDTHHDTHHDEVPLKPNEIKLLQMLSSRGDLGAADLRKAMKLRNAPDFRERYLRPLSRNVDRSLQTDSEHFGSPELTEAIIEKRPRFVFCGHIHTGRNRRASGAATHRDAAKPSEASAEHGGVDFEGSRVYNVSRLDERYEITYEPTWVEV